ncbi:hypothetical protein [Polynucleobacter sp. UB-Siik-W21]|jgi:hypothetical protein|uniref:hypothetical protein n=1 Tax=Polynucleobacter sp. UB-Siik-W21 TaxID=1855646 RepID=UPI001BFD7403|nr:hypothetical protein [Polynucleobacter sp. UB-Siik-W21]QWD69808.1 hypothetical protein C2756_07750 [Polynucleobacter sp. UB-Siik-W21]
MATHFIQVKHWRRFFLVALPIFLLGCISSQPFPQGVNVGQPIPTPIVRAPKVGQEWVYQVRNVFNQEIIDTVTERVVSVGSEIRIARSGVKSGPLPDEIQAPWGFVLQDPHWSPPQKFQQAIPLWPEQLQVGWYRFYKIHYQVPAYPDGSYYWGLNMSALAWEQIQSPLGKFLTLHLHNEIPYFESNDLFRVQNIREEDVWFSPEIGRWVIRRGSGRYITPGVFWSNAYWEDYWQWELVSWK